jgi:hypothetical protein
MVDDYQKVVDLRSRRASTEAVVIPPAMAALRDKVQFYLANELSRLLDDVDDTLFELADEASTPKEQHIYFDSMREIRVNRQTIEQEFNRVLDEDIRHAVSGRSSSALEMGRAKLQLLESDALEELVAIEGMGKKAERRFLKEIWVLCAALQQLTSGPVVAAAELPFGPQKIAKALGRACRDLQIDIKARLVLFKLFDTRILEKYDALFQALVPVLESQGLNLDALAKRDGQRDEAEHADRTQGASDEQSGASAPPSASALVSRLIEAIDGVIASGVASGDGRPAALSKPSFMVALQDMQRAQYSHFSSPEAANEKDYGLREFTEELVSRLQKVGRVGGSDASALTMDRDIDTINFVGTLFQYMLDGDGLSEPLKALVARLQIPILKTAMLDKNFFSHEEHPARKLLSALVSAGIGWSPVGAVDKDPLFRKVEEVVMRVLSDFNVDTQIFSDVYQEFAQFQEKALRRAELLAKRTVDAEGGRATAETARGYVTALLDQKLEDGSAPVVVAKILREGWSKVLFLSYVQHGPESERFHEDASFVDRLLWSIAPSDDPGHRSELISALPLLVETLRLGFNRVSLSGYETKRWFEQLERLHLAKLSRKAQVEDNRVESSEMASEGPSASLEELDKSLASLDKPEDDATVQRHSVPLDRHSPTTAVNDAVQDGRVDSLRVGNWVDFRQQDGKMMRCRLAAVINGIGKYIFVNRAGIKVAEFNRDGLRAALEDGSLMLIEEEKLFDRALESVISNLRDMKDKPLD